VVNGYFPSITIKDILTKLSVGALGINAPTGSIQDHVSLIMEHFQRGENEYEHIYLLIHNIDGANIRNERAQTALSILASCPNIHIIASIDHINAGLLWDSIKIARFNWIWHDATTFDDYMVETSFENTLMVRQSELGGSRGVNYVLASLTSNARGIFRVLAEHQIMEMELANMEGRGDESVGLTYNGYYTKCREAFFVSNDITFRTQLTEFRDHKVIQSKRSMDGTEVMYLPLDKSTLTNILETLS
jgi:origin recognition complex subunit 2